MAYINFQSFRPVPFSMSQDACDHILTAESDWKLIVKFLHYNGAFHSLMTADEAAVIRQLGDGFGPGIKDPDLIWDWSHVRDSSEQAVKAMADMIRQWANFYVK